jgi:hypothetical protein
VESAFAGSYILIFRFFVEFWAVFSSGGFPETNKFDFSKCYQVSLEGFSSVFI